MGFQPPVTLSDPKF